MGHGKSRSALLALVMAGGLGFVGGPALALTVPEPPPADLVDPTTEPPADALPLAGLDTAVPPVPNGVDGILFSDANRNGVRDPGELPLVGVTITQTRVSDGAVATAVTDQNGYFFIATSVVGDYVLTAEPDGHDPLVDRSTYAETEPGPAPTTPPGSTTPPPPAQEETVTPVTSVTIKGSLVWDYGNGKNKPVQSTLTFTKDGKTVTVQTKADGTFTTELAPGDWKLSATVPAELKDLVKAINDTVVTVEGVEDPEAMDLVLTSADKDCSYTDFDSVADAQATYDKYLAEYGTDIFNLDADGDGKVCEQGLSGTAPKSTTNTGTNTTTAARATPTANRQLARTGSESVPVVLLASGLIAAGTALRLTTARRQARVRA